MVKDALLSLLEEGRGGFLSGEEVAARLGVTRNAVWKAAEALRQAGYPVEAVKNRGYRLAEGSDKLSPQGIGKYLSACPPVRVEVLPSAPSTNDLVRARAEAGEAEGLVLIAEEQTAGRGRLARPFYSPRGSGLYMSLLLRPVRYTAAQAVGITSAAAVAVCDAVGRVCGREARIKWVNDVFVGGKKACGILTEASVSMEDNCLRYVVLGIGINVYEPAGGFPPPLDAIAAAVFPAPCGDGKNKLAAAVLERFFALYARLDDPAVMEEYRRRSCVVGQEIDVLTAQGPRAARALDIGADGHLLVRYADGSEEKLYAGEIGIRVRDSRAPARCTPAPDGRACAGAGREGAGEGGAGCSAAEHESPREKNSGAAAPDNRFREGRA